MTFWDYTLETEIYAHKIVKLARLNGFIRKNSIQNLSAGEKTSGVQNPEPPTTPGVENPTTLGARVLGFSTPGVLVYWHGGCHSFSGPQCPQNEKLFACHYFCLPLY